MSLNDATIVEREQQADGWTLILWKRPRARTSKLEWGTHVVSPSGEWYFGRYFLEYDAEEKARQSFDARTRKGVN